MLNMIDDILKYLMLIALLFFVVFFLEFHKYYSSFPLLLLFGAMKSRVSYVHVRGVKIGKM